jgi:hypothetical protein
VGVGDEAQASRRLGRAAHQFGHVEAREARIDGDPVALLQQAVEAGGSPFTRISSTSVCGTPSASIMCLVVAFSAHGSVRTRPRRSRGRKSFSSA